MARAAIGDLTIGRVGRCAACVPRCHFGHAARFFKIGFDAPETAARHDDGLHVARLGFAVMQECGNPDGCAQRYSFQVPHHRCHGNSPLLGDHRRKGSFTQFTTA